MRNPYSLVFGKEPAQMIARMTETMQIIDAFSADPPSQPIFMITGMRGSGKTVLMTDISKRIRKSPEWIVVELNPSTDMLRGLAAKLSSDHDLSVPPIVDMETALSRMLESIKKHGKKVLVTIDEVSNTEAMRIFASAFQIFIRNELPVCLLMTGLYDNIHKLQNEDNLTFLYRAPKLTLGALNLGTITKNYMDNLQIDRERAGEMARLTRGYSFAFQVLGYYTWEHDADHTQAIEEYRQYLEEYVYDKVWSELSQKDKTVLYGIARSDTGKIKEILQILEMENNQFAPYRKRLLQKGLIESVTYGYVRFTLPLFEQYVLTEFDII